MQSEKFIRKKIQSQFKVQRFDLEIKILIILVENGTP